MLIFFSILKTIDYQYVKLKNIDKIHDNNDEMHIFFGWYVYLLYVYTSINLLYGVSRSQV